MSTSMSVFQGFHVYYWVNMSSNLHSNASLEIGCQSSAVVVLIVLEKYNVLLLCQSVSKIEVVLARTVHKKLVSCQMVSSSLLLVSAVDMETTTILRVICNVLCSTKLYNKPIYYYV
jgi:hypothetical protein